MDIEVQRLEQLNGTNWADWSNLKTRRVDKDRKLFGNITIHTDIDNSYLIEFRTYKKQGGEYRLLPYRLPKKKFCDAIRDDDVVYPDLAAVSDFEMPAPCPYKKVTYSQYFCN